MMIMPIISRMLGTIMSSFLLLLVLGGMAIAEEFPEEGIASLSNGLLFPLVGVGVGNMDHRDIVKSISKIPESQHHIPVLIDTAQASDNDSLILDGILAREARLGPSETRRAYHVLSKVWYTHLGYNRTRFAVQQMLHNYKSILYRQNSTSKDDRAVDLYLTVLIHWPRCDNSIPWMDCAGEEMALSEEVRSLGPDPATDPSKAFIESWHALEDLYLEGWIHNIGLSNFYAPDLQTLFSTTLRVSPTINQISIWSLFFDVDTRRYMRDHANAIVYQVYGAMTEFKYSQAPFSYNYLRSLANSKGVTVPQLGLAWFIQLKISVIPRSSNEIHLLQNSIDSLLPALPFDSEEIANIEEALANMLQGEDSERFLTENDNEEEEEEDEREEVEEFSDEGVTAWFTNRLPYPVELFWIDPETDERWPIHKGILTTDQEFAIRTVYGGVIRAYSADDGSELPSVPTFYMDAQNGGEVSYDIEENGDASEIEVWFHNNLQRAIRIFWVHPESGEKYPAVGDEEHVVSPDERIAVQTSIGHVFHAYHEEDSHASNSPIKEFQIERHHSEAVLNFEPEL